MLTYVTMTYRPATEAERPAIITLLEQATLLTDDLPNDLSTFRLVFANEKLAGVAGLEILGENGLLRSVAVSPDFRNQSVGNQLVGAIIGLAESNRITMLYLITTTADLYFERLGFSRVDRTNVPDTIAQTRQFSELCPASAVVMYKSSEAPASELNQLISPKLELRTTWSHETNPCSLHG